MPLSSSALIQVSAQLSNGGIDLVVPSANFTFAAQVNFENGTGANQADRLWADSNTLADSASADVDLAGSLTDALGQAVSFARVKAILVRASAANTNSVVVGGAAANAFAGPFGGAAHTIAVNPGGVLVLLAPDATGWPVTADTADILRFANGGAGSSVTYDALIIGASA
jgi:hypothetical protein